MPTGQALQITPGDLEVFKLLFMLNIMTIGQIRRIRYYQPDTGRLSAEDNVRKRLRRLWDAGYLSGHTVFDESWTRLLAYTLADRAIPELRRVVPAILQAKVSKRVPQRHVDHALMVSECACRILEGVRESDIAVPALLPLHLPFYTTYTVGNPRARKFTNRFVTHEDIDDGARCFHLRPDIVFALQDGAVKRLFFLEADRGTEGHTKIAEKLHAYFLYSRLQEPWQRYDSDIVDFRILFVTTTQNRLSQLRDGLSDRFGYELVAFTTFDALRAENAVFSPIWQIFNDAMMPLISAET
jgi:hypothetical protein